MVDTPTRMAPLPNSASSQSSFGSSTTSDQPPERGIIEPLPDELDSSMARNLKFEQVDNVWSVLLTDSVKFPIRLGLPTSESKLYLERMFYEASYRKMYYSHFEKGGITKPISPLVVKVVQYLQPNDRVRGNPYQRTFVDVDLENECTVYAHLRTSDPSAIGTIYPAPAADHEYKPILVPPSSLSSVRVWSYTAYENVNGISVYAWLIKLGYYHPSYPNRSCVPTAAVYKLGRKLLEVLRRFHRSGWVHRDLHGGNVMLRPKNLAPGVDAKDMNWGVDTDYDVVLLDFGLSRRWILEPGEVDFLYYPKGQIYHASTAALYYKPADPYDDLESLGYLLANVADSRGLPWINIDPKFIPRREQHPVQFYRKTYWPNFTLEENWTREAYLGARCTDLAKYIVKIRALNDPRTAMERLCPRLERERRTMADLDVLYDESLKLMDEGLARVERTPMTVPSVMTEPGTKSRRITIGSTDSGGAMVKYAAKAEGAKTKTKVGCWNPRAFAARENDVES